MTVYKQTFVARYGVKTSEGDAVISGAISAGGDVSGANGNYTGNGYFGGTGYIRVGVGTQAQRPATPSIGMVRFNVDYGVFEGYFGDSGWGSLANSTIQPLDKRNNLSDLTDVPTARTNLGVYSKDQIDAQATAYATKATTYTTDQLYTQAEVLALLKQATPSGLIAYFPFVNAPTGWLKANGAAVSRTAYADLYNAIGTTYGTGDGSTTFNVPDLRGEFLRGYDDGRGVDASRVIGSFQSDLIKSHTHTATTDVQGTHTHTATTDTQGTHNHATDVQGDHQHISPFGDQGITYPYGQVGANNLAGSHGGNDSDNNWPYTSVAGAHAHNISSAGAHAHNVTVASAGAHGHTITVAATGGTETRPRNVAMLACIKY